MNEQRSPSEIQIQAEAWKTVWAKFPDHRRCFFHVPNESTYNNNQQASSGVVAGIQDMFFLSNGRAWLIELKDQKGVISAAQKVVHAAHKKQGFDTYVFRSAIETVCFIEDIVKNHDIINQVTSVWGNYISPYSRADMYETYLKEYQDKKKNR